MEELKNMPVQERLQYLHDSADEILENEEYTRPLTEDELMEAKDKLSKIFIKKSALEREKKEEMKAFNEDIKSHEKSLAEESDKVKTGFLTTTGRIYELKEYEEQKIYRFDQSGELIGTRPFTAADRQHRIREFREGTND